MSVKTKKKKKKCQFNAVVFVDVFGYFVCLYNRFYFVWSLIDLNSIGKCIFLGENVDYHPKMWPEMRIVNVLQKAARSMLQYIN